MADVGKIGIVFVHGIQGKPEQFGFLTRDLPACAEVRNELLPGHGKTVAEFRRANGSDWIEAVRRECFELKKICDRIYFVGHSMGCLLGIIVQREEKLFSGMLLLSCPFRVRPTFRYFIKGARSAAKKKPRDPFYAAGWEANSVKTASSLSYLTCAHPYIELFRLIRRVNGSDEPLETGARFFFSRRDEIVDSRFGMKRCGQLSADAILFEDCGHEYFTPEAMRRLSRELYDTLEIDREDR